MKKYLLILFLAFTPFTIFAMAAEVVSTKGKAEVQNGNIWIPLKVGDKLAKGSVIQTGFKSELVLKIKSTTVTVDPLSRLTIEQLAEKNGGSSSSGRDETKLFLDTGSLRSNVKKSDDRRVEFTVRSQVATAAVRGTIVDVIQKYKSTQIKNREGSVAVWKTRGAKAKISTDEEDSLEANPPISGNSLLAVADEAPAGAFLTTKGNTIDIGVDGTVNSALYNAKKNTVLKTSPVSESSPEIKYTGQKTPVSKDKTLRVIIQRVD